MGGKIGLKMESLRTLLLILAFAGWIKNGVSLEVWKVHPKTVGTHGGATLRIDGNGLGAHHEFDRVRVSLSDGILEHDCELRLSECHPRGKWIACEIPALLPGSYMVMVNGERLPEWNITARDHLDTWGEITVVEGYAGGDSVHINSLPNKPWRLHHDATQLRVTVGGFPVHLDHHSVLHRDANETHVNQLHLRVPTALRPGWQKLEIVADSVFAMDGAHGRIKLARNEIFVRPSITQVVQCSSNPSLLRVHGTGFSPNPLENIVTGGTRACKVLEADFHMLLVNCESSNTTLSFDSTTEKDQTQVGFFMEQSQPHRQLVNLQGELAFPIVNPAHPLSKAISEEGAFWLRTTENMTEFVVPESCHYHFHVDCSGLSQCSFKFSGGAQRALMESVFLRKGSRFPVEAEFRGKNGTAFHFKLSATVSKCNNGLDTERRFHVVPSNWFQYHRRDKLRGFLRVKVAQISALCRNENNCGVDVVVPDYLFYTHEPFHSFHRHHPISPAERVLQSSSTNSLSAWVAESKCWNCVIPDGMTLQMMDDVEVGSLVVQGNLYWNVNSQNNPIVSLTAGFMVVESGGQFHMDATQQVGKRGVIYIKNNGESHPKLGQQAFGSYHDPNLGKTGPVVRVEGYTKSRTWSLLKRTHNQGERLVELKHNVASMGWQVGDRIAIAGGGMPITQQNSFLGSEVFEIGSIDGNLVHLGNGKSLSQRYVGDATRRMECEVINLSRNIIITGDDFVQNKGLHTVAQHGGTMQISHARIEKCGRRGEIGRYCLHFHHMHVCKDCLFKGNAVEDSHQRGIIVHGTHHSKVENNVLFNVRGAGIYVEDGNEMHNVFKDNVNICPSSGSSKQACRAPGTDNDNADEIQQSGMWTLSMTNDFIGNRMVGHYNAFFTQVSAFIHGRGSAAQRLCTRHAPLGKFSGNVHHSNWRFGFYLDNNWPRNVNRDAEGSDGMVVDMDKCWDKNNWCSCDLFKEDGTDNGVLGVIQDGVDWGNDFVGSYEQGDIQYLRFWSVNNLKNLYWKHTKNFADGVSSHIKDSGFGWYDFTPGYPGEGVALVMGPGGLGAFIIENSKFFGSVTEGGLCANQHCSVGPGTGALCTPVYTLVDVDFSEIGSRSRAIRFGISDGNSELPMFNALGSTNFGDGFVSMASSEMTYLLNIPGNICTKTNLIKWDNAIACKLPLRRLQVWSPDQGTLELVGPGGATFGMKHIQKCPGCDDKQGYGAPVLVNHASPLQYSLKVDMNFPGRPPVTLEFSDNVFGTRFAKSDEMDLMLINPSDQSRTNCRVSSQHDRKFIGPFGPERVDLGACREKTATSPPVDPSLPCEGPYSSAYPTCEDRIQWMISNDNWKNEYYAPYKLDGTRCTIQNYLATIETYCPVCSCKHTPTNTPTTKPTNKPTFAPTNEPTDKPTFAPTNMPTFAPTNEPTDKPTFAPTNMPTFAPSANPTSAPSLTPSHAPSLAPTKTQCEMSKDCANRIDWMLTNDRWNSPYYAQFGVQGNACSVQNYLADVENHCQNCACGRPCQGPYGSHYATCEDRIDWMLANNNWKNDFYAPYGLDGTRCSVQNYLAKVEKFCPSCDCDGSARALEARTDVVIQNTTTGREEQEKNGDTNTG